MTPKERFWAKVEKRSACWIWLGTTDDRGYGRFTVKNSPRKVMRAHRFSYEDLVRPLRTKEILHHTCANANCVNPDHLRPMMQGDHARSHLAGLIRKETCAKGHPFDGHNGRQRTCSICLRSNARAHYLRKGGAEYSLRKYYASKG